MVYFRNLFTTDVSQASTNYRTFRNYKWIISKVILAWKWNIILNYSRNFKVHCNGSTKIPQAYSNFLIPIESVLRSAYNSPLTSLILGYHYVLKFWNISTHYVEYKICFATKNHSSQNSKHDKRWKSLGSSAIKLW